MIEIICIQERLGEQWIAPSSVAAVNKDEEGGRERGLGLRGVRGYKLTRRCHYPPPPRDAKFIDQSPSIFPGQLTYCIYSICERKLNIFLQFPVDKASCHTGFKWPCCLESRAGWFCQRCLGE